MTLRPTLRPLSVLLGALLAGCSSGPSPSARMQEEIAPHLEELARFDRWARRLSLADSAFRSEDALEEAAFAPLRRRPRVVAAWLERVGPDARALRHPHDAPALPEDGWVTVRTEALGELVAQRRAMTVGGREAPVTLIRRSRDAPGGAVLHVTMAFGEPPGEDDEDG